MIEHLSHSSLTAADNCVGMFYATRLGDKISEPPDKPRDIGKMVHAMIQHHRSMRAFDEPVDQATLLALVSSESTEWQKESLEIYERWAARDADPKPHMFLGVEVHSNRSIEDIPLPIIGYDDLIYLDEDDKGSIVVVRDSKTGWGNEITDEYREQGRRACWRYLGSDPSARMRWEVEFVRTGTVISEDFFPNDVREVEDRIMAIWVSKIAEIFGSSDAPDHSRYQAGDHCGFCPLTITCATRRLAESHSLIITDMPSAQQAAQDVILFRSAVKKLTGTLKSFSSEKGPVSIGDITAQFNVGVSRSLPKAAEAILQVMSPKELGVALKIDTKVKTGKALLDDPRFASLVKEKAWNKFEIKGKIEDEEEEDAE